MEALAINPNALPKKERNEGDECADHGVWFFVSCECHHRNKPLGFDDRLRSNRLAPKLPVVSLSKGLLTQWLSRTIVTKINVLGLLANSSSDNFTLIQNNTNISSL